MATLPRTLAAFFEGTAAFDGRVGGWGVALYPRRANFWTFVDVIGIEPTNNAAEQDLRHAAIWRKLLFGTQSASGSRFVERLLTVIETCRRQKRDTYAWLADAVRDTFTANLHHRYCPPRERLPFKDSGAGAYNPDDLIDPCVHEPEHFLHFISDGSIRLRYGLGAAE